MTKVQMLFHITGGRADGTVWPPAGGPLTVSATEAEDLYRAQIARPWPSGDEDEQAAEADASAETEPSAPEETPAEPVPEQDEPVTEQAEGDGPPRPAAPKADWADWSLKNGATAEWVESATKQQMMEHHGARP